MFTISKGLMPDKASIEVIHHRLLAAILSLMPVPLFWLNTMFWIHVVDMALHGPSC